MASTQARHRLIPISRASGSRIAGLGWRAEPKRGIGKISRDGEQEKYAGANIGS